MRVLVTGSEGFTGTYVCEEFNTAGWEVWRAGSTPRPNQPYYLHIDLLNPRSLEPINDRIRPQVVIHLAASAFVAESDPQVFYRVNFLGTNHLLETLSRAKHPPLCTILASSANVYGNSDAGALSEEASVNPENDYALSKLAMEYVARTYMDKIGIVITRPFNYTGVGQSNRFLVPKIVSHFKEKKSKIDLGNTQVSRDFSDVRDVARIYRLLAHRMPLNEVVNICSGSAVSLEKILEIAKEITSHDINLQVKPELVRENEVLELLGEKKKLEDLVGPGDPYSLEQTLEWMLSS